MAVITQLELQKDKSRANVYLDGVFVCGLELAIIMKHSLKKGCEISEEELNLIKMESDAEKANRYALALVNKKRYTKKELINKLKLKDYSPEVIELIICKMEEYHYIDDTQYVQSFINSVSGKSIKELELSLLNKGIDKSIISKALSELEYQDEDVAKKLYDKFMRFKEPTKENKNKAFNYLYRKGFSVSLINNIIGENDVY